MFRIIASGILYVLGDLVSQVMFYVNSSTLYTIYNRLMTWSCELDTAGKIWKFVDEDEESS